MTTPLRPEDVANPAHPNFPAPCKCCGSRADACLQCGRCGACDRCEHLGDDYKPERHEGCGHG